MSEIPKRLRQVGLLFAASLGGAALVPGLAESTVSHPEGPTPTILPSKTSGLTPGDKVTSVRELEPIPGVSSEYRIVSSQPKRTSDLAFIYSPYWSEYLIKNLNAEGHTLAPNTAIGTLISTSRSHLLGNEVFFNDQTEIVTSIKPAKQLHKTVLFGTIVQTTGEGVQVNIDPIDHGHGVEIDFFGYSIGQTPSTSAVTA